MKLWRASSLIAGLTLISRLLGFTRDIMLARILGAGLAADAFNLAFKLPNIFRRLFAEGAFSAAFIPLFNQQITQQSPNDLHRARRFAEQVLSLFLPILLLALALAQLAMPILVWGLNGGGAFKAISGKFELAVHLTRLTFPYLVLISLASLLGGILNSLSRFAAAAAAPILLNLCMIAALLGFRGHEAMTAQALALAVTIAGLLQFLWLLWACQQAGYSLRLHPPVLTPAVRQLGRLIIPATFGAGIYQISQFVDLFFASRLPQGSLSYLNYADRLNQLPLGVIGIALGTAILPTLSRHIAAGDSTAALTLQNRAAEMALLLTVPAAAGLALCAQPIVNAFYLGGRFAAIDALWTAQTLCALILGLPAYVLLKVLTPAFFARSDTRTPVKTAAVALALNIILNLALIGPLKIVGLALATALSAWMNCALLYGLLYRRGLFQFDRPFWMSLRGIILATLGMALVLSLLRSFLAPWLLAAASSQRLLALALLITSGLVTYFSLGALLGAYSLTGLITGFRRNKAEQ